MHNAVMCTLSLYDVIGITRHLYIKLKSFSNIALPLHKEAVGGCSFLYIIAKKSVIMSEAFLVDVSIFCFFLFNFGLRMSKVVGVFALRMQLSQVFSQRGIACCKNL